MRGSFGRTLIFGPGLAAVEAAEATAATATAAAAAAAATDAELDDHAEDVLLHSSGQEVGYAENNSGTATDINTASNIDIPSCVLTIAPNPRPIWLEAYAFGDVTTAPSSGATTQMGLIITDDANTIVGFANASFEGGAGTLAQFTMIARCRIAPNTAQKTYRMQASKNGGTGVYRILNGAIHAAFKSYLVATAH